MRGYNIFDEGEPSGAQHGNVALHSQSLAGDGSITAICHLAEALKCIWNRAMKYSIRTDAINMWKSGYDFFFFFLWLYIKTKFPEISNTVNSKGFIEMRHNIK